MEFSGLRLPKLILAGGLLVVLATYSMGWSGTLHFDDEANLNGLYGVSDFASGLQFTFSGEAGPTGRPLSRATFAFQHESWPDPRPFLIFNTLLHILNGLLCFLLLRRLLGWILSDVRSAEWLAVTTALIWAASPFLASSNLMTVQRMTGLSAFFALLALNIYAIARTEYRPDSWRSNLWLASIAGVGTLLAGLAKENGFLLPIFLLLIEWLLAGKARIMIKPLHRAFFRLVLVAPGAVILGFLFYKGLSSAGYGYREYTLMERLLTQPRVMFDYIFNLLIPATDSITPFHDAYGHSTGLLSPVTTLLSIIGLVLLLALAWVARTRWPIVAFGLMFFLAGHLAESTVVPLELYFPHRNYIPSIGLYLAVVVILANALGRLDFGFPLRRIAAATYWVLFMGVLISGTMLWGNRQLSAEMWYIQQRDSNRAAQNLYQYYVDTDQMDVAGAFINRVIDANPGEAIFSIQALSICDAEKQAFERKLNRVEHDLLNEQKISVSLAKPIQQFAALAADSECPHFGIDQAERLVSAALGNRNQWVHRKARQALLFARAQLTYDQGKYDAAIAALEHAMEIDPILDAALIKTFFLMDKGDERAAQDYVRGMLNNPPVGFPENLVWKERLEELLTSIHSGEDLGNDSPID